MILHAVVRRDRILLAALTIALVWLILAQNEALHTRFEVSYTSETTRHSFFGLGSKVAPSHSTASSSNASESFWRVFSESLAQAAPQFGSPEAVTTDQDVISFDKATENTSRVDILQYSDEAVRGLRKSHSWIAGWIREHWPMLSYVQGSRGIVTIGGDNYMPMVVVSIRMLRRTNSTLPVEVFLPTEESYEPKICDEILPALNARCVVLSSVMEAHGASLEISRYQYKIFSILLSNFEDILFLDSDNFPVQDPARLFTTEPFISAGLVTWPDYWASTASHLLYEIVSLPVPPLNARRTTESGQLIVSKRIHAKTLMLAAYYNLYGPSHFYKLLSQNAAGEGDKETFILAASVMNTPFYQVTEPPATPGYQHSKGGFHGSAMLQKDPFDDWRRVTKSPDAPKKARPMFLHAHYPKLNAAALLDGLDPEAKRMWGPKASTVREYGSDLESAAWEEVLWTGCDLENVFLAWKNKDGVCEKVTERWKEILEKEKEKEKKKS